VKLLDFGIPKLLEAGSNMAPQSELTRRAALCAHSNAALNGLAVA
jgi:hypothetical protein